jgi:hypothetical protein
VGVLLFVDDEAIAMEYFVAEIAEIPSIGGFDGHFHRLNG